MTAEAKAIDINIMGREFRVACLDGQERPLLASVELVNRKMQEIRDSGKIVGNERIAIMAALNIAHDFMTNAPRGFDREEYERRIIAMGTSLEEVLVEQDRLF